MYFQNVLAFSVALLAGTTIAADYNSGDIPSNLRKGRSKLRAADLLSGSSSAQVATVTPIAAATPSSSAVAEASKVIVSMSSVARATSSAPPSSSKHATRFQTFARPPKLVAASSSTVHRPAQGTHAAQTPASSSSTVGENDVSVPVQELAKQADATGDKDANKPFWSRPVSDSKPRPNAPDFSEVPETRVDDKDSCSLRCQDLANQCVELLPKDNDFW